MWARGREACVRIFTSPHRTQRCERKNGDGKKEIGYQEPIWRGHADFTNPFEFATFMRAMQGVEFDVMLESKSKDLALLRLRKDLPRYAPDVARRFGLVEETDKQALAS